MSDSVVAALEAAIQASPDDPGLRAHLARVLVDASRFDEGLTHAQHGLRFAPADTDMLQTAAEAARRLERDTEADGYDQLLRALGGAPSTGESEPTPDIQPDTRPDPVAETREAVPIGAGVPDSVDELLASWDDAAAPTEPEIGELSRNRVTLADVGGMYEVKKRLQVSFLAPMKNPEMRAAFGKSMRGGLLLWGPPGCGKTYMAKAVAGELDANFYQVGLSDVLDMWIGASEKNLSAIFDTARRNAPCVLFLDEIDALGQKRTHLRAGGAAMRGVVNQLLQEMDGASSDNEGVFILAATNHPWDIDSALLRPGRLDRMLLVLPPDREAREAILELHMRGRPIEKLNLAKVAGSTDGYTGADLALICEHAAELAMTDSIESGSVRPIGMKDFAAAVAAVKPSHGPWIESARNFAMFNNETGNYDELLSWLKKNRL